MVKRMSEPLDLKHVVDDAKQCRDCPFMFGMLWLVIGVELNQQPIGMKVYVTDEKELIMKPVLKWVGNPDITIAVKAFGLKATVQ
ncbi:hypothetical protein OIU76_017897, partial [Salix suchowensis]